MSVWKCLKTLTALHSCGKKSWHEKWWSSEKNEASDFQTKAALTWYVPIDAPSRALIPLDSPWDQAASISEWYRPWLMKLPMRTAKIVAKPTGKIMTCHWGQVFYSFLLQKNHGLPGVANKPKNQQAHRSTRHLGMAHPQAALPLKRVKKAGSPVISTIMIVVNRVTLETSSLSRKKLLMGFPSDNPLTALTP